MRVFRYITLIITLLFGFSAMAFGQAPQVEQAGKLLPERLGDFRALAAVTAPRGELSFGSTLSSAALRSYVSKDGQQYDVILAISPSNSSAYAKFTRARLETQKAASVQPVNLGTQGFQTDKSLAFVKGQSLVIVGGVSDGKASAPSIDLAKSLAETIDKGEGDIPVLIKHLPNWENVYQSVFYAVDKASLTGYLNNQPVLDALNFDGGAEAAVAEYNGAKMVLIEFNTPQIAGDNDQSILSKLQTLQSQSQPMPTAYRRVGNYAVFVFGAQDVQAANQLIDQVKYQQMVQWLGENPYRYDRAIREFSETTLGVFVNVVKASGLVLLGSFAVGGLVGAFLFTRRRKQRTAMDAYTDAGGMLRLNLDDLTAQKDPARLLGPGN